MRLFLIRGSNYLNNNKYYRFKTNKSKLMNIITKMPMTMVRSTVKNRFKRPRMIISNS